MSGSYDYKPLADDEVRVLRLESRLIGSSDPLRAIIEHVTLGTDFLCLSYVWGAPPVTGILEIEGFALPIGSNLNDALIYLSPRKRIEDNSCDTASHSLSPPIWVDAICINQSDESEKSKLVHKMDLVYSGRLVWAWLGHATEDSHLAIQTIKNFHQDVVSGKFESSGTIQATTSMSDALTRMGEHLRQCFFNVDGSATKELRALQAFFAKPYWTRVWIMQEVILARNVSFLCGSDSVDRDEVRFAYLYYMVMFPESRPYKACIPKTVEKISTSPAATLGVFGPASGGKATLKSVLQSCHIAMESFTRDRTKVGPMKATDPRDYIFGIAGLARRDLEELGIKVDYKTSVQNLFTKVAIAYLEIRRDLDILGFCQFPKTKTNLPSWVPDWTMCLQAPVRLIGDEGQFNAASGTEPSLVITQHACQLHILGYRLGKIAQLGMDLNQCDDGPDVLQVLIDSFALLESHNGTSAYITKQAQEDAVWKTLILDSQKRVFQSAMPDDIQKSVGPRMRASSLVRDGYDAIKIFAQKKLRDASYCPDAELEARIVNYAQEAGIGLLFRRVFISETGHLSIGPSHVEVGDEVVILAGCTVPVVLRPQGDLFTLVGEAYVHGIMYGEYMETPNLSQICFSIL